MQVFFHDRPEGLFPVHLHGFGKGISQHGNSQGVRRGLEGVLPVPQAVGVDADIAAPLLEPIPLNSWT